MWKRLLVVGIFALLGALAVLTIVMQFPPGTLGLQDGQLRPCPSTPHCVSTQADPDDSVHYVAPIRLEGTQEEGLHRAKLALAALHRTSLIEQSGPYLQAVSRSGNGIFAQDVEILIDAEAGLLHFRAASRLRWGDTGRNHALMESFRAAWNDLG